VTESAPDLRPWVLLLAIASFGAGLGAGWWSRGQSEAQPAAEPAFAGFERRFVEEFDLSSDRARALRALLANYQQDLGRVEQVALTSGMAGQGAELSRLGVRYRDWIRNLVLPPDQRDRFDQLSQDLATWKGVE
jgi:hypothetical protein